MIQESHHWWMQLIKDTLTLFSTNTFNHNYTHNYITFIVIYWSFQMSVECHFLQIYWIECFGFCRYLVSVGASVETGDNEGTTAMHYAAIGTKPAEIMSLLISYGLDVNVRNKHVCHCRFPLSVFWELSLHRHRSALFVVEPSTHSFCSKWWKSRSGEFLAWSKRRCKSPRLWR